MGFHLQGSGPVPCLSFHKMVGYKSHFLEQVFVERRDVHDSECTKGIATAVVIFLLSTFQVPGLERVLDYGIMAILFSVIASTTIAKFSKYFIEVEAKTTVEVQPAHPQMQTKVVVHSGKNDPRRKEFSGSGKRLSAKSGSGAKKKSVSKTKKYPVPKPKKKK